MADKLQQWLLTPCCRSQPLHAGVCAVWRRSQQAPCLPCGKDRGLFFASPLTERTGKAVCVSLRPGSVACVSTLTAMAVRIPSTWHLLACSIDGKGRESGPCAVSCAVSYAVGMCGMLADKLHSILTVNDSRKGGLERFPRVKMSNHASRTETPAERPQCSFRRAILCTTFAASFCTIWAMCPFDREASQNGFCTVRNVPD